MMTAKKFLFVSGCARSGTSALTELLGNHPAVVMGMERYGNFYDQADLSLSPEHFEKERFFGIRPEDTFYADFDAFHAWDPDIRAKFDDAVYVGDKRPNIHRHYPALYERFPGAIVYYIFREVHAVAGSWEVRKAAGTDWSPELDFAAAVNMWNESLQTTLKTLEAGFPVVLVNYKSFFAERGNLEDLFTPLDLPVTSQVMEYYNYQQNVAESLAEMRNTVDALLPEQRDYIDAHADFAAYERMLELSRR